jgi:hypothetical protein
MISRDSLPKDAAEWSSIYVSLPRLSADSAESCPATFDDIFNYVSIESADVDSADKARLIFLRTAKISHARYWLWRYTESDGKVSFVAFREDSSGSTTLVLASPNGLSEEQFLLADYYSEIYWS